MGEPTRHSPILQHMQASDLGWVERLGRPIKLCPILHGTGVLKNMAAGGARVGGAFLLLISSTSELSQTESVTAKSLVGLSNG